MRVKLASPRSVYFIDYFDKDNEYHSRQMEIICNARTMVDIIERKGGFCQSIIRADLFGEPVVIYSDGEWLPHKKTKGEEKEHVAGNI